MWHKNHQPTIREWKKEYFSSTLNFELGSIQFYVDEWLIDILEEFF